MLIIMSMLIRPLRVEHIVLPAFHCLSNHSENPYQTICGAYYKLTNSYLSAKPLELKQ